MNRWLQGQILELIELLPATLSSKCRPVVVIYVLTVQFLANNGRVQIALEIHAVELAAATSSVGQKKRKINKKITYKNN